jgi:coenzyme F420-reducing hydrogenase beta subunit
MISFDFNSDCCGCFACKNICSSCAIDLKPDNEGFNMPVVNKQTCTECGLCEKVCPNLNSNQKQFSYYESFSDCRFYLYYSNENERMQSASGGFFYDLGKKIIEEGGYVCACVWDQDFSAHHIVSNKMEDLKRMQSSKYVQSNIEYCYAEIRKLLLAKKTVLFCGTPCQTSALYYFFNERKYTNLISVSLICHGVPSPKVWSLYKTALEKKTGSKLSFVNMRDKDKYGYKKSCCKYIFENGKILNWSTYLYDIYISIFLYSICLRNTCYHCHFKGDNSHADIIAGDYYSSSADNKGVSSLIICSDTGNKMFDRLSGYKENVTKDAICKNNSMLYESVHENKNRIFFFDNIDKVDIIRNITQFLPVRFYIKKILNRIGLFDVINLLK